MKPSNAERRRPLPLLSATAFARLLDVAPSTVTSWIHEGMPTRSKVRGGRAAQIAIADAMPWVIRRRRAITSQQERLFAARAEGVEQGNAEARRSLVRTSDLGEALACMVQHIEQIHLAAAERAAPEVARISDPPFVRGHLLTVMREVRERCCEWIEKHARELDGQAS